MSQLPIDEAGARVEVGECHLDTDIDIALADAESTLCDEERRRAASFVFTLDRDRFVRGRGYLRRRLGALLGLPPSDVPLATGDRGKPFLEGGGVNFNLSNSGPCAVVALTSDAEVGIDLEVLDRWDRLDDQLDGLAQMCLTCDEQDALAGLPAAQRVRRFLSFWTAKEARMKLTGEGFALDPLAISLELSSGVPVGYHRPTTPATRLRFIPLSRPDAVCCVALAQAPGS